MDWRSNQCWILLVCALKFSQLSSPAHSPPTRVTYCTLSHHPPVCTHTLSASRQCKVFLPSSSFISVPFLYILYSPPHPTPNLIPSGAVPGGQKGSLGGRGGDGGGPSRSDSVKSMMMGASKASRWQMAQGRTQSEDLKSSKWVEKESEAAVEEKQSIV